MFNDAELAYVKSQRLLRLATVDPSGQPDNSAVGFEFDGEYFWIGGMDIPSTRKFKNVAAGNTKVALIIDDYESIDPWKPRGVRVFGTAEIADHEGMFGPGRYIKVTPKTTWNWLVEESFEMGKPMQLRRTDWT